MLVHFHRIAIKPLPATDTQMQHFREIRDHLDLGFIDEWPDCDHQLELVERNVGELIEYLDVFGTALFEILCAFIADVQ